MPSWNTLWTCTLSGAALFIAVESQAALSVGARVFVTGEHEPGHSTFDILVDDHKDLHGIVYTYDEGKTIRFTYRDIVQPSGENAGHGGVIVKWRNGRPVFVLMANRDTLDRRHGGKVVLRYLHNGRHKNDLRFKSLVIHLVREKDEWMVLTDDHLTTIQSLCFRKKTYLGWVIGAEKHEINVSCPK